MTAHAGPTRFSKLRLPHNQIATHKRLWCDKIEQMQVMFQNGPSVPGYSLHSIFALQLKSQGGHSLSDQVHVDQAQMDKGHHPSAL